MGHGNRRARGSRRKQKPSPVDIIAGVDTPVGQDLAAESSARLSPTDIIVDSLGTDDGLSGGRSRDTPTETTRPIKRQRSRSASSNRIPAEVRTSALGKVQGFWGVWVQHQEYLRGHSLRWMSNNLEDAEDALSNAMLLAQRKYPQYAHSITNTRAWLTRLVHNVCMDHHRAASRMEGFEWDLRLDEMERRSVASIQRTVREPDQEVIEEEQLTSLLRGLQKLSASLREPLMLRCVYGLAYSEIADRMNMNECAVRKRVQLARDKLRKWIGAFQR